MSDLLYYISNADHLLMQVMIRLMCLICVGFFIALFFKAKVRDLLLSRHGLPKPNRIVRGKNKTIRFHHSLDISVGPAPEKEKLDEDGAKKI